MRVVRQLAEDSIDRYPLAANEATHHMYMDDYINSIDGFEKAKETYHEMVDMFNSGGFNLTKWISNDTKFLNEVPSSHKNPHAINFDSDAQDVTKIAGMQWHPKLDTFTFKTNANESPRDYTKRLILSINAHNENFEESKITVLAVETSVSDAQHPIEILAERSSSWSKLLRTIVYMLRFSKRKLDELYTLIQSNAHKNFIENRLAEHRIQFKHSPPYGPHFNGLSEINVRCVKTHLYKVVGTQILTYEELNTIIIQIENLLNSRPLCILSSDPSDLSALTPNHFLNLTPAKYLPVEDLTDIPDSRLSRYQLLTKITCSFWKRWSQEYLTSLQHRQKWNTPSNPVSLGAVVVIKDSNVHPLCWPLGVIEELYPGKDSIIRAVKVRTRSGSYIRPVVRICPLPSQ
ncbi:uncharacterized protein LOC123879759 isoform X2 [Maniola jurtina]|uniref:uncharacterized protein LOC123879759 isoform X1 n=1 Tax=Maniola jurtina TaxID=191418 RepID=UPI001E68A34C|nr:uncharacterized protein LOC123879759 isoform X1 [Maniola jurtina]XP_045783624.1 uncharacterized protein LOC123879759 isoform X2 [Maniola jurtina]